MFVFLFESENGITYDQLKSCIVGYVSRLYGPLHQVPCFESAI